MFRLAHKEFLWLYALIPVFIIIFLLMMRWKKKALNRFGEPSLVTELFPDASVTRPYFRFLFLLLAVILFIFGMCGPQIGTKLEEVKRKGVDIVITLDVSNSMNAEDIRPTRLERSKQAIYRLIDRMQGDRLGLIVFAGQAYVQLPITTDYGAAKLFLQTINSDIVPTQGTAIGSAIDLAVKSIGDSIRTNTVIVVITDGENHEDDALEAAKAAAKKGIIVHTIGMGSPDGAPIPVYRNGLRSGFVQDESGNTVVTKLDPDLLQNLADAGKGKFVRATNNDDGLELIMKEINSMEKKEFGTKMFTDYEDQFQYFIGTALLLLLIEFLMSEKKSKLLKQWNLFGVKKKAA
ncbi:MAG TPA: VWA domain-containing protein [Bacteroidia bacterium]|nr:VWA domain-containing protein [Bacteroidia bacterium]